MSSFWDMLGKSPYLDPRSMAGGDLPNSQSSPKAMTAAAQFVPGVGDAIGLLSDAAGYIKNPKSLTPASGLLSLLGVLPMVPNAAMFLGPLAKTADLSALERAKAMLKMGADDAQVWKETGWWVNTHDGVPRFEIDDSVMRGKLGGLSNDGSYYKDVYRGTVGDAVEHEEFAKAYPEIMDYGFEAHPTAKTSGLFQEPYKGLPGEVQVNTRVDRNRAWLRNKSASEEKFVADAISDGIPESDARRIFAETYASQMRGGDLGDEGVGVVAHELQHAVQAKEGMVKSGDLAEMEARLVEARRLFTEQMRRNTPPIGLIR
jgi:hypothetical protein